MENKKNKQTWAKKKLRVRKKDKKMEIKNT